MAKVPRHRRPGRPTGLRGVTAGWWLAGELQVSPGQAVLLKAGGGWRREHLEGEVAPSGGQGGPASVTMGIHRSEPRRSAVAAALLHLL
jgi:hypothetical protein